MQNLTDKLERKVEEEIKDAKKFKDEKIDILGLRDVFAKETKEGLYQIASALIETYSIRTISEDKSDTIFTFDKGIYSPDGKNIIKSIVSKILGSQKSNHYLSEILGHITCQTIVERNDFEVKNKDLICLDNGILNIKTNEIIEHSPDYLFRNKFPISFDQSAECPKIEKFFSEVFYPDDIALIQEWIGYCLTSDYLFKKAIIFVGQRDTGKSTFLNLLVRLIGKENISTEDLYKLNTSTFSAVNLYNKFLNIFDDLSFRDLTDVGTFKMLVGRSLMRGEQKFKDSFSFYNFAKLTFSCNKIPTLKEKDSQDDAYYDRWIVVPMENEIKEKNPNLFSELTIKSELSGLLNYALVGLKRLMKKQNFSRIDDWKNTKKIMDRSGSPLACFADDMLIEVLGNSISKQNLYEVYCRYTEKNQLPAMTKDKLGKNLIRFATYITSESSGTKRFWRNVDFKNKNCE